ncbi:MAG: hypothetical protein JWM40_3059 [Frankiales bacterium]|nr:hypothetical protein [Frankiales bacterium]
MEPEDHYRGQREELSSLFASLDDEQLATVVPGSPEWVVKDVLAHLVGVTADFCSQNLDGAGTPPWTQAQVDSRRSKSVAELVEEWSKRGVGFEASMPEMGFFRKASVYDVTVHGDDVREALGLPLGSSATHAWVLDGIIDLAERRAKGAGTLILHSEDNQGHMGAGEPTAELRIDDRGEMARVFGGRRTDEQVLALDWAGDPTPWLDVLPLFREGR